MKTVGVIDYGSGNFGSVWNALEKLDVKLARITESRELAHCSHVVLPGVGAFGASMERLREMNILDELASEVLTKAKPFLGICVGMQLLAGKGHEHGTHDGLGWVDAEVQKLVVSDLPLPHVGWNTIASGLEASPLTKGMDADASFYFVHSFAMKLRPGTSIVAETEYGQRFPSIISKDNIHGVQFHPEKSQFYGLKLLRNFTEF